MQPDFRTWYRTYFQLQAEHHIYCIPAVLAAVAVLAAAVVLAGSGTVPAAALAGSGTCLLYTSILKNTLLSLYATGWVFTSFPLFIYERFHNFLQIFYEITKQDVYKRQDYILWSVVLLSKMLLLSFQSVPENNFSPRA